MTTEIRLYSNSESRNDPSADPALVWSLALAGAAPFAAAFVASRSKVARRAVERAACPIRRLAGIPCPSCGSARAFLLLAQGDKAWRNYNTVTVAYAVSALAASLILRALPPRTRNSVSRGVAECMREHPALAASVAAAPAWFAALTRPAIRR